MDTPSGARPGERLPNLRRFARRALALPWIDPCVFLLVLVSVVLLFVELAFPPRSEPRHELELVNETINVVFVLELALRYLASTHWKRFLRDHWIDILAVMPLLRVFRLGRAFRLVRLLRVLALGLMLNRRMRLLNMVLRGGGIEFVLIGGFLVLAMGFGTVGLATFETRVSNLSGDWEEMTISNAFWTAVFSMFSAQYHMGIPDSAGGRIVVVLLLLFGIGITAMLTGTVAAVMVAKMREGAGMKGTSFEELEGHVVLCGWNSHAPRILEVLHQDREEKVRVVVVAEMDDLPDLSVRKVDPLRVHLRTGDFTRPEVLRSANIEQAKSAIILSDQSKGRTLADADARTVLAALTIEKICPRVRTSAELYEQAHESHLRMAGVDDVVIAGEFSGPMLAHSALERGVLDVVQTMLRGDDGARILRMPAGAELDGKTFDDALPILKRTRDAVLLAVDRKGGNLHVNPSGFTILADDVLVLLGPKRV